MKLSDQEIRELRKMFDEGLSFATACNELDIEDTEEARKLWDKWEIE